MNIQGNGNRGVLGMMGAILAGAGGAMSNVMEFKARPREDIIPASSGAGLMGAYGRRTASGHTRIRRKNRLHISKATKRKHRN